MRRIWVILKWATVVTVLSAVVLYAGDDLSVRRRMTHKTATDPLETMNLRAVYSVPRKDGKAEFDFGDPQSQTCVHSLFPHLGYNPCWYVLRESSKPIPIGVLLPASALICSQAVLGNTGYSVVSLRRLTLDLSHCPGCGNHARGSPGRSLTREINLFGGPLLRLASAPGWPGTYPPRYSR